MHTPRLRIAWFSDLSKGRSESLSTYCSRLLLPELSRKHSIEVFSDSFSPSEFGLPNSHYLKAYQRHRDEPFDIFFYQVEDGRYCRFVRSHIGLIPGVVWIHDLLCMDRGPEACHTSPWERSIKQVEDPSLPFADRAEAAHQLWPQLYREISLAPVVLFSSDWSHGEFLRMTSDRLEATEGGHHSQVVRVPVSEYKEHHCPSPVFRVAYASETGIDGRAHKFLPVLGSLQGEWHLRWMVSEEESAAALELLQEFGLSAERVELCTSRDQAVWERIIKESDLAVHLSTSSFGHLAPFLQISMAGGCPAMVSQCGQGDDVPSDVAFKILPGSYESSQIKEVIDAIRKKGKGCFGDVGVTYSRAVHNPSLIVDKLSDCLVSWVPQISYVMSRWDRLLKQARGALLNEVRDLVGGAAGTVVDPYRQTIEPALQSIGWK